jgi:mannose-6-phosphate isomerase-like protein (cupin superfamily)
VGPRDWGEEVLLVLSHGKFSLKKLTIKKGAKGGLQFHRKKDEAGYIIEGTLLVRYESRLGLLEEKVLTAGCWFHFPAGAVHQEEALTDVIIIEASTPHFNDRVRVDRVFGMKDTEQYVGLPTTLEAEIEFR